MPIPGSDTLSTVQSRPFSDARPPAIRIGMNTAEIDGTVDVDAVAVLLSQRTDGSRDLLDERRGVDRFEMHLHLPGVDLRQVENIVDQREEMLRRAQNPFQRLDCIL